MKAGKYEVGPYLEEIKDKIEVSYPKDILAIIAERKVSTIAGSCSSGVQAEPGSVTPDPALPLAQIPSNNNEINNSAIGK